MANKSKILKEDKKEFERRICENMGNGFEWLSANWSILKIAKGLEDDGELIDPDYQRKIVWDSSRKKALVETILQHGGNKIPTITLRQLDNGKYEIVDGKQRLIGSIKPFVEGKTRLNGVYTPELRTFNINDIEKEYPQIYSAFMNTTIPVQIAQNMTDEEAKTYFIQINESGVNMKIGEKIHANQGTPLIKVIEDIQKHKVWDCVSYITRDNDYAYISRMLLYIRDYGENSNVLKYYTNPQLMKELQQYLEFNVPSSIVSELIEDLDILHTVICKNKCNISIPDAFSVFLYVHSNKKHLLHAKFGQFIKGLYDNMPSNTGIYRLFNMQKNKCRATSKYYDWYVKTIDILFNKFVDGADWNELQRLQVKI